MIVKTDYAQYNDCELVVDAYCLNNAPYIAIVSASDGPIATLTVCLDSNIKLKPTESFVDTNNCPWAEDFIAKYDLGVPTHVYHQSGYCMYPLYDFKNYLEGKNG